MDIVYFDADDLSADAEARQCKRVRELFGDLAVWIYVKNEARVHLWYDAKFGRAIPPYVSTADAVFYFSDDGNRDRAAADRKWHHCPRTLRIVRPAWPDRQAEQEADHQAHL